jgi:hypothetical protein
MKMDAKTKGLMLISSTQINCQTTTKQSLYTVPSGKTFIPVKAVVRSPSASLAGMVDFDFGGNAAADDWLQQISLNAMTATTDYVEIAQPDQAVGPPIVPNKKTVYAAAIAFGIKINTGSTGAATAQVDLFGYLY